MSWRALLCRVLGHRWESDDGVYSSPVGMILLRDQTVRCRRCLAAGMNG